MACPTSRDISELSFFLPASGSKVSLILKYTESAASGHLQFHWIVDLHCTRANTKETWPRLGRVSQEICKCKHNFPMMIVFKLTVTSGIIKRGHHDTSCIVPTFVFSVVCYVELSSFTSHPRSSIDVIRLIVALSTRRFICPGK